MNLDEIICKFWKSRSESFIGTFETRRQRFYTFKVPGEIISKPKFYQTPVEGEGRRKFLKLNLTCHLPCLCLRNAVLCQNEGAIQAEDPGIGTLTQVRGRGGPMLTVGMSCLLWPWSVRPAGHQGQ